MERFLTFFWLLLIPTQLGRHVWLNESSVLGIRVDYLSLIFYATDIAWLLWVWTQRKKIKIELNFFVLIMLLFMGINVIFAEAKVVAVYRWIRIWQWWLTWQLVILNKLKIKEYLLKIVPWWIVGESFLGLAQIVKGGSINGLLWWLGERRFVYGGIGIAQMRILDEAWIRAYGTFSHPNSLAGFLLLAWWWFRRQKSKINQVWYWVVSWSAVLGIILTGSRTVWVMSLGMLIAEQFINKKKFWLDKKFLGNTFLICGVVMLILGVVSIDYRVSDFLGGWDVSSLQKRELLGVAAVRMIKASPLFGVGAGNFMVSLPKYQVGNFYWMQPVHNIVLLIWSEIGLIGIVMFLILGAEMVKKINWRKCWWLLVIVGITGMVDHYWVSLPQNSWLLAIILGVI